MYDNFRFLVQMFREDYHKFSRFEGFSKLCNGYL